MTDDMEPLEEDDLLFRHKSPFQLIEMWDNGNSSYSLTLDGNVQFVSGEEDEGEFHKALATVPASMLKKPTKALILGGGDGLAARELLKSPLIISITLVEIDPAMINLAKNHRLLKAINNGSMSNPKVTPVATDAENFVSQTPERFGLAILDFPDPIYAQHKKLYSLPFYRKISNILESDPVVSVQSSGSTGPVKSIVASNLESSTGSLSYVTYYKTASTGSGAMVYGGTGVNPDKIPKQQSVVKKSSGLF